MTTPVHLQPTAELAERVLLPGDPGRALRLAQWLLEKPRMFNHARGLWGYTGTAGDGQPMTIQSTGMGGPSAAIVISELIALGAARLIRVGTCGALDETLRLGSIVMVADCLAADGTSRALSPEVELAATPSLQTGLADAQVDGVRPASVRAVSTDLFYEHREGLEEGWMRCGAAVVEMETATLYALARRLGVAAAALLIVSDLLRPQRVRIDFDALMAAEERAGRIAASALRPGAGSPAADRTAPERSAGPAAS